MGNLFNIESPFFQWLSKFADRIILNILYVITCMPVVTIGASTAALYNVSGRIDRAEGHVWRDYWKAFRSNFKQATVLWIVLLVSGMVIGFGMLFYLRSNQSGSMIGILIVALLFFLWAATSAWVFPLQSRFENSVQNTLKNSLIFGLLYFPRSIVVAVINLFPLVVFLFFPTVFLYLTFIWLMVWFSMAASINLSIFKNQFTDLEKMSTSED